MKQFLEITGVALRTVIHKDFVDVKVNATGTEVVLQDGFAQEVIALLRTVSAEALLGTHFMGSLVHRLYNSGCQGLCHITNTQRYHVGLGMHHLESVHLLGNISEQVVLLQVQEMYIY